VDKTRQEAYVKALVREIENIHCELTAKCGYDCSPAVDSIFFGGGTPSVIDSSLITDILDALRESFRISADAEISIEGNPGSISPEKLEAWLAVGINRLSIGAQSTNDDILCTLGRIHCRREIFSCFQAARSAGFNSINMDLIFAVPGQSEELWEETLLEVITQNPEHISFYSLEIEENTPLQRSLLKDEIEVVSDECDRRMYHRSIELLRNAGYIHYEISNAARPGFECRHNLKYWSMEDYLGFGLGAHSFFGDRRRSNVTDIDRYLTAGTTMTKTPVPETTDDIGQIADRKNFKRVDIKAKHHHDFYHNGFLFESHENTEWESISEFMFLGLRKLQGISISEFKRRFGKDVFSLFAEEISRSLAAGLLSAEGDYLRLTARGIDFSNQVFLGFM
jgi:oxygen-independent coproporphyrinogen-3 oxidase